MFLNAKSFDKKNFELGQLFPNNFSFDYDRLYNWFQKTLKVEKKIELGQFFTNSSPFDYDQFRSWFKKALKIDKKILEPFAGANNLVKMLSPDWKECSFVSYDIDPKDPKVQKRDTLKSFPKNFKIAITNPPWLAKNSAKRKQISFPKTEQDNLYKFCLEKMLKNCEYVAAIIPATFIQSKFYFKRLESYTLLPKKIFSDTENPVCLALFVPKKDRLKTNLFIENQKIGSYEKILNKINQNCPPCGTPPIVRFNIPSGNLGIFAVDSTLKKNIKFVKPQMIPDNKVKNTSRHVVRICVSKKITKEKIKKLNFKLSKIRSDTNDILLSPFKGLMKNGDYRRRISFSLIRKIIISTI